MNRCDKLTNAAFLLSFTTGGDVFAHQDHSSQGTADAISIQPYASQELIPILDVM